MPKKTKKQKILAEYRRKLQSLESKKTYLPSSEPSQKEKLTLPAVNQFHVSPVQTTKQSPQESGLAVREFQAIKKDLRTSLFLIVLTLGIEIGIWRLIV